VVSGGILGGLEFGIVRVLSVPPGQTLTDQVDIHVGVGHEHAAQRPAALPSLVAFGVVILPDRHVFCILFP
jgi:hypothetical protein